MQDPAPHHDLSDVYDVDTLALVDGWNASDDVEGKGTEPTLPSRLSRWSRSSLAGAAMTGIGLALREVYDPPPDEQIVVEVDDAG